MYGWRSEEGVGVLEFVIALPVVMLVLWGGFAMSLHLLDGMLVKYGAYEEARRAVLHNPSSSYLLPVARVINGWGSGVRGLILTGSVKKQGKDIVVTVTRTQPWLLSTVKRVFSGQMSWFGLQLSMVEDATGQSQVTYSLPQENARMYSSNIFGRFFESIPGLRHLGRFFL
ncbi:MAG: pilus assembly protein [Firmicutes bacterium]|nr:pilus assembly protein [Bacillota bacterium]